MDTPERGVIVGWCISQPSLMLPTLSIDDDYPEEELREAALWFAPAIMVWRETA